MQNAKYLCRAVVLWMSLCYDESSVKKRLIDCVIDVFLFICTHDMDFIVLRMRNTFAFVVGVGEICRVGSAE